VRLYGPTLGDGTLMEAELLNTFAKHEVERPDQAWCNTQYVGGCEGT
jgi:hypothetical protein